MIQNAPSRLLGHRPKIQSHKKCKTLLPIHRNLHSSFAATIFKPVFWAIAFCLSLHLTLGCASSGAQTKGSTAALMAEDKSEASLKANSGPETHGFNREDEVWRAKRPPSGTLQELRFPEVQEFKLRNGLRVFLLERHDLPIVRMSLVSNAGSFRDTSSTSGLAYATYEMLGEGTSKRSKEELADAFATIGTHLESSVNRESGSVSVSTLKEHLLVANELLYEVVSKPAFSSKGFRAWQKRHAQALKARSASPEAILSDTLMRALWGRKHAYARPVPGTLTTLKKLSSRKAKSFWNKYVGTRSSRLVIVGDISESEVRDLTQSSFAKWRKRGRTRSKVSRARTTQKATTVVGGFPNAPQTQVAYARVLAAPDSQVIPQARVAAAVLGGMFTSRLNLALREERGWTYGAHTSINYLLGKSLLIAGSAIESDHALEGLEVMRQEIARLQKEGITEQELEMAKADIASGLGQAFATLESSTATLGSLYAHQLSTQTLEKQVAQVQALSKKEVDTFLSEWLDASKWRAVLVGDAVQLKR